MSSAADQLTFFVRLMRLEKVLPPLPTVGDSLTASFFGITTDHLTSIRSELSLQVESAAKALLSDESIATAVDNLSFSDGEVVVGLGDSLIADALSWFEILAAAYRIRHPNRSVTFVNAGVSGDTTTQILARVPFIAALSPAHVLFLGGGNDARHFGSPEASTQVSLHETSRNLAAIRGAFPDSKWLWLTPPASNHERMKASPFWASMQTFWKQDSLEEIRDLVGRQQGPLLDLRRELKAPPEGETILGDGLHPTLLGHQLIAGAVISKLTR